MTRVKSAEPSGQHSTPQHPLASLHVLLPRPWRPDDSLVELLTAQQCRTHRYPVLGIAPSIDGDARQMLRKGMLASDIIIFISRNSVEQALNIVCKDTSPLNKQQCPLVPDGVDVFAVGNTTASSLNAAGITALVPPMATSEGLLAMPQLQSVAGKRIMICKGAGGRGHLAQTLGQRGADVSASILYRRQVERGHQQSINRLLAENDTDVVVIHSGEIFSSLWQQLTAENQRRLQTIPLLVPSKRIAAFASKNGCQQIIIAENAMPESMVAGLLRWYT